MLYRNSIAAMALAAVLLTLAPGAPAQDATKYPDWSGQWRGAGGPKWDPSKPPGRGQQAPLTPEYQAIFDAALNDTASGGQGLNTRAGCLTTGMPRQMTVIWAMEILISPATTHILFENIMPRRVYTDGRGWPEHQEPSYAGYSLGRWIDDDGDGRYDVLEIETRNFKGPRTFETSGIPLHKDNATVIKERIRLDKAKTGVLLNDITVIDNALTRPWTVTKIYRRQENPVWVESICSEGNNHVFVGKENYFLSADGDLMPARKNQPPPNLKYFKSSGK